MPSPSKRLVVFGDSNIATVKRAVDEGLLGFGAWEHEFWGAAGPEFRHIHFGKGAMRAIKPEAEKTVLHVNGNGRKVLKPNDFDLFVFYGARLRLAEFFAPYLSLLAEGERSVSDAVLEHAANAFLQDRRSVRMAEKLKEAGAKDIVFAYAGFPVWGVVEQADEGRILAQYPTVTKATSAMRQRIVAALEAAFSSRGLRFMMQPEDSIVNGMFTDAKFAVEMAAEKEDASHKSPAYAAMILASLPLQT